MILRTSNLKHERYIGLDLIRMLCILALCEFHVLETFFYEDHPGFRNELPLHFFLEPYVRVLCFSGFIIVALSAFLLGRSKISLISWAKLLGLLWFGWLCLALLEASDKQWFYFEWDIYSFLLTSFTFLFIIQGSKLALNIFASLGLIALSIAGNYEGLFALSDPWQSIFLGDCQRVGYNEWPLLPWIGLPLVFFALGRWSFSARGKKYFQSFEKLEYGIWPLLLIGSLPQLGRYYNSNAGPGFYCSLQGQSPLVFWSHMLWPIFLARLSFLPRINSMFERFSFFRFVSQMEWSTHFGLCYALHLLWINFAYVLWADQITQSKWLIEPLILGLIPLTEISSRALRKVYKGAMLKMR